MTGAADGRSASSEEGAAGSGRPDEAAPVTTVRVSLPPHLRRLAGTGEEVRLEVAGSPTIRSVLDALESRHPALEGTIRDHGSGERRAMIRFFACGDDLSHEPQDTPLPEAVTAGEEVLHVVGAIAGG